MGTSRRKLGRPESAGRAAETAAGVPDKIRTSGFARLVLFQWVPVTCVLFVRETRLAVVLLGVYGWPMFLV